MALLARHFELVDVPSAASFDVERSMHESLFGDVGYVSLVVWRAGRGLVLSAKFTWLNTTDDKISVVTFLVNVSVKISVTVFAQLDAQVMLVIASTTINASISLVFDTSVGGFTIFDLIQPGYQSAIQLKMAVLALKLSDCLR